MKKGLKYVILNLVLLMILLNSTLLFDYNKIDSIPEKTNNLKINNSEDLDFKIVKINGSLSGDKFGFPSNAGDLNKDGFDDIVIGQIANGISSIFLGRPSSVWNNSYTKSDANVLFGNEGIPSYAGDVNGDNYSDFILTNPELNSGKGQTNIYLGRDSSKWSKDKTINQVNTSFIGEFNDDRSGHGGTGVGDVNNDGYDDIVIGALDNDQGGISAGKTYLILGSKSFNWNQQYNLTNVNASFIGGSNDYQSSVWVSKAGDMNGDGFDDFAIGSLDRVNGYRRVYIIFGRDTSKWKLNTSLSQANVTFSTEKPANWIYTLQWISGTGDVNNDGYDDLIVGDYINGVTYLILGRKSSNWKSNYTFTESNASFIAENKSDYAGYSVTGAGDVNADGFDDILIGAYNYQNKGKVYLILGRESSLWIQNLSLNQADYSFEGNLGDWLGYVVSGAGDVDKNGYDDFIVSATTDLLGYGYGSVYLFLSNLKTTITTTNNSLETKSSSPNTPGFEIIALTITLSIAMIKNRRFRKKL